MMRQPARCKANTASLPGAAWPRSRAWLQILPLWVAVLFTVIDAGPVWGTTKAFEHPQYLAAKKRLIRGWGTWDARNVLEQALLPECFSVTIGFKEFNWIGQESLSRALIGRKGEQAEQVRPGLHALDGSYSEMELRWQQLDVRIESAAEGNDLVILVTPLKDAQLPVSVVVGAQMLWNHPGQLARAGESLVAKLPSRTVRIYATGKKVEDPYVQTGGSYLVVSLAGPVGISAGRPRSVDAIRQFLARRKKAMEQRAARMGQLRELYSAVESGLAWNTIYEPAHDRLISTVGRLWDEEYGGYALFGWDNFFLAYMTSLFSQDLACANFVEHLRSMTPGGFIPNDDRGNGMKSWDRSQPPVGSIMLKEIYKRYPERWLLEASFDDLLVWNRWWIKARKNGDLLSYGSSLTDNPFQEPDTHGKATAGYESGMDDSPMYENVPFNAEKSTLELQDVGLSSLYVADCKALAEIAALIGRNDEAEELKARARQISEKIDAVLWDEKTGAYLNRHTDTGEFSFRMSPTAFYPLLARIPAAARAERTMKEHFFNPAEFYGDFMLPSIARNDPAFPKQKYWKGSVWPPLNFLVYLGLRNYGIKEAQGDLSEKSKVLFLQEWRRKGFVSENYSGITGTGDDPRLSSDAFHSWGALMGFIALIEAGKMPAPEAPLATH
jgi:putative isomerase